MTKAFGKELQISAELIFHSFQPIFRPLTRGGKKERDIKRWFAPGISKFGGFFVNVNLSFEFVFSNDLTPSPAKFSQCGTIRQCTPRTGLDPELIKGNFGSNRARTKPFIFTTYFRISGSSSPSSSYTLWLFFKAEEDDMSPCAVLVYQRCLIRFLLVRSWANRRPWLSLNSGSRIRSPSLWRRQLYANIYSFRLVWHIMVGGQTAGGKFALSLQGPQVRQVFG